MLSCKIFRVAVVAAGVVCLSLGSGWAQGGASQSSSAQSGSGQSSSSSSTPPQGPPREKAPSLVDPAGPTISLVSSEPLFFMAATLNACGYDQGLEESSSIRTRV